MHFYWPTLGRDVAAVFIVELLEKAGLSLAICRLKPFRYRLFNLRRKSGFRLARAVAGFDFSNRDARHRRIGVARFPIFDVCSLVNAQREAFLVVSTAIEISCV